MRPRRIRYASSFARAFARLTPEQREATIGAVEDFVARTRENALRPERKAGLRGIWAFRVDSGVRVFYTQGRDEHGTFSELFHVGPHDDYRTVSRRTP